MSYSSSRSWVVVDVELGGAFEVPAAGTVGAGVLGRNGVYGTEITVNAFVDRLEFWLAGYNGNGS